MFDLVELASRGALAAHSVVAEEVAHPEAVFDDDHVAAPFAVDVLTGASHLRFGHGLVVQSEGVALIALHLLR